VRTVFISYSHKDEVWKDRIVTHLGVLAQEGKIETWDDRRIAGGDDWQPEIENAIQACDTALLLISADFLTSKFILGREVPQLLARRAQQGLRVIPLIVCPCAWTEITWLKGIQARPKDGKALLSISNSEAEEALAALAKEIMRLSAGLETTHHVQGRHYVAPPPENIYLAKLPKTGSEFFGRENELKILDQAWTDTGRTHIVEFVAFGGVGKTALVKRWIENIKLNQWQGARRVYGWSFYSQGTSDGRQASEDPFLADALAWFKVKHDPTASAWDKGRLLADEIGRERTLFIIDGIEPLQYAPGPLGGQLRAPGLQVLLGQLASAGHPGLCIVTTRETIKDLTEHEHSSGSNHGTVLKYDLGNLSDSDGARLLFHLGINRCGAGMINSADDDELIKASHEVQGHALTLRLLGCYIVKAYNADLRKRDHVKFSKADDKIQGGHAFKMLAAYEKWLDEAGEDAKRGLSVLRLLGLFDRPADAVCIVALRKQPVIEGLTEALVGIDEENWNCALSSLEECGLISSLNPHSVYPNHQSALDTHPLIREYFAKQLREKNPDAWREGHRRLHEFLTTSTKDKPNPTLEELQPLYQAVSHGCKAGMYEETRAKVYRDRILKGTGNDGFYSTRKLGAFGADLGAVACFFVEPWKKLSPVLAEPAQAWLLNQAAVRLRALGRLREAVEPMRVGLELRIAQKDWENATISASNLSELELTLGDCTSAVSDARKSVEFADKSEDKFHRMGKRTTLADSLHQAGQMDEAQLFFREAEKIQVEHQPEYPLLYSLPGFRYCDLLLSESERAAWQIVFNPRSAIPNPKLRDSCREIEKRAQKTLEWAEAVETASLLTIALDHLTLGRTSLYLSVLDTTDSSSHESAIKNTELAVNGLRASGTQFNIPLGLLTRSLLRFIQNNLSGSQADLSEAQQIAERGSMQLHLAEVHLHRGRLFKDKAELAKARAIIEKCGYWRRKEELEDAEGIIG
jgi:tetratricopeptide (TPR) repeat protein